jgi:hypothetical protein
MPKKGELSKTARASLANRAVINQPTNHICPVCNEIIWSADLYSVQRYDGNKKYMVHYHKDHYKI